jgi:chlorobactene glucosyltransferase
MSEEALLRGVAVLGGALLALRLRDTWRVLREPRFGDAVPPRVATVSVIIPARDEAGRIGPGIAALLRQQRPPLEVLVIDDHSRDATVQVVHTAAGGDPLVRVVAGQPLPHGWLGKSWACQQGARLARGEWLVFLDADVVVEPAFCGSIIAHALAQRADLLSALPLVEARTAIERLVLPAFTMLLTTIYPFAWVNDPRRDTAFAIGQCLVIRRGTYERLGGHAAVRRSILEDMELAGHFKRAGARIAVAGAADLLRVRMYDSWPGIAEGLRKHARAGLRHGGRRAALVGTRLLLEALLPAALLVAGLAYRLDALIALALASIIIGGVANGIVVVRRHRLHPAWSLALGPGLLVYFILAGSAVVHLARHGSIAWRGRQVRSQPDASDSSRDDV